MSLASEFAVRLSTSSAVSLQWYCRTQESCTYTALSVAETCTSRIILEDINEYESRFGSLTSACHEILLQDGTSLLDGGDLCTDIHTCASAVLYRIRDGKNALARCPVGTEMVLQASANPTESAAFRFLPQNTSIELLEGTESGNNCTALDDASGFECLPGVVSLRFTDSSDPCDSKSGNSCPTPGVGTPFGDCQGTCRGIPERPEAPIFETDFGVLLQVTNNGASPSLEYHCRSTATCTHATIPSVASTCQRFFMQNKVDLDSRLSELHPSECNEIVLENQVADCDTSCSTLLYLEKDGKNKIASCPAGTELVMNIAGVPSTGVTYVLTPTAEWIQMNGEMPNECVLFDGKYRCQSGTLSMKFSLRGQLACDVDEGECADAPTTADVHGSKCPGSSSSSSACLAAYTAPPPVNAAANVTEFGVRLQVSTSDNAYAPSLRWYCRSAALCTYAPESLADECEMVYYDDPTDFERYASYLRSSCQQVILQDVSRLMEGTCGFKRCPATFFWYKDGRDKVAVCPAGTEMVLTATGIPGTRYTFAPTVEGTMIHDELPEGCNIPLRFDQYRCDSGSVHFRFSLRGDGLSCDSSSFSSCPKTPPAGGKPYGLCSATPVCSPPHKIPVKETPAFEPEFSVRLATTSTTTNLLPDLEWRCLVDEFCFASPESINATCPMHVFNSTSNEDRALDILDSGCNRLLIQDLGPIVDESCSNSDTLCVGLIHRIPDVQAEDAICPTGTQMVVTATGQPALGSQSYIFTPSPGTVLQELPSDCFQVYEKIHCRSGTISLAFGHGSRPTCLGRRCVPPDSGTVYGHCRHDNDLICIEEARPALLLEDSDTFEPTRLPTEMPVTWPPTTTFGRTTLEGGGTPNSNGSNGNGAPTWSPDHESDHKNAKGAKSTGNKLRKRSKSKDEKSEEIKKIRPKSQKANKQNGKGRVKRVKNAK